MEKKMKRKPKLVLCTISLALILVSPVVIQAFYTPWFPPPRLIDPIVSTDWLADNIETDSLVILDVRAPPEPPADIDYIPGSINVPGVWYINPPGGLLWELPATEDLFAIIGAAGITEDSLVVVVGGTSSPFYRNSRVAFTLLYAGIRNVAILDGGYDVWASEERDVDEDPATPTEVTYEGTVDETMLVSKDYVADKIGKRRHRRYQRTILVDSRDADAYFLTGHIPTAKSLPTPWLLNLNFDDTGTLLLSATYKDVDTLKEMASGVVGKPWSGWGWSRSDDDDDDDDSKEIIVYCGVGAYASTMFFVLREVLGYRNVKLYDGSWEEWTSDPTGPIVQYEWE
jgi:thiosulfate/3-mercaptopyruvate sulfurtransferase